MSTRELTSDERAAVGLYAVMARDFMDFLEFIQEESTTNETLVWLYKMLTFGSDAENQKLNELGVGPVQRQLEKRGIDPRSTI